MTCQALVRQVQTFEEMVREEQWLDAMRIYLAPWYRKPFAFIAWWIPWAMGARW